MMKRYLVASDFEHGRTSYREGQVVDLQEVTAEALKANRLLIDYKPPNPQQPVRESSASRPGRRSTKQTAS